MSGALAKDRGGEPGPRTEQARAISLSFEALFDVAEDAGFGNVVHASPVFERMRRRTDGGREIILDRLGEAEARCAFCRIWVTSGDVLQLKLRGASKLSAVDAGGWVLAGADGEGAVYWLPDLPHVRKVDEAGRIISEEKLAPSGVGLSADGLAAELAVPVDGVLDLTVWRLPAEGTASAAELNSLLAVERQGYFLYASHCRYQRPADLFRHVVFGMVYNREFVWPHYWRIPDELDAYALYQICCGLETATGKGLYRCFREQLVYSIIARQREDGGWYHGEWTDEVECHARLHVGGMHLLAAALEERYCPVVCRALEKAAEFIVGLTDETAIGTWFLHDSLEHSPQSMSLGPFRWRPSRVLGKSESNMLVLNTHLDTIIALERYARVTGDERYEGSLRSARGAAEALLRARPLEAVYRLAYRLIDLTWKPPAVARRLPLPLRVLKRLTWKYLMPRMNHLRTRFPRLVMPTGFVDRAIALSGVSDPYQTVNLWDLVRYARLYPDACVGRVIKDAARYTQESDLRRYWAESRNKGHSLGFWTEALWHICLDDPEPRYRAWLAEAVLLCEDTGYGLAPAVLGVNAEAIPPAERVPKPSPASDGLRVINLSRGSDLELIVVNVTKGDIALAWETSPKGELTWRTDTGEALADEVLIPGRGWVQGRSVKRSGKQVTA